MNDGIEQLTKEIRWFKNRQRLSNILGTAFTFLGTLSRGYHIVSPRPEPLSEILLDVGLLALGIIGLTFAREFSKGRKIIETQKRALEIQQQANERLEKQLNAQKKETMIYEYFGPNRPIYINQYQDNQPPPKQ